MKSNYDQLLLQPPTLLPAASHHCLLKVSLEDLGTSTGLLHVGLQYRGQSVHVNNFPHLVVCFQIRATLSPCCGSCKKWYLKWASKCAVLVPLGQLQLPPHPTHSQSFFEKHWHACTVAEAWQWSLGTSQPSFPLHFPLSSTVQGGEWKSREWKHSKGRRWRRVCLAATHSMPVWSWWALEWSGCHSTISLLDWESEIERRENLYLYAGWVRLKMKHNGIWKQSSGELPFEKQVRGKHLSREAAFVWSSK